jgi:uncharacterized protein (DUF3084 family)
MEYKDLINFNDNFCLVLKELGKSPYFLEYQTKEIENKILELKEKIKQLENEFSFLDETVIEKYKKIEKLEKEIELLQEEQYELEHEYYVNQ